MSRNLLLAAALLAFTGSIGLTVADDAKNSDGHKHNPDKMMASCVAVGNQEEIAIAEFAREKTQNDDVKKFAEMMITDHHTFLLKLRKFAPEATQPGYIEGHAKEARADDADAPKAKIQQTGVAGAAEDDAKEVKTADGTRAADGEQRGLNFSQIERELAAECLALTKAKLGEKSGAQFDQCFIGQQIGAHMGMKAKLTVLQRHASPELAKVFAEGLKTTEHHLAKAEELAKQLTPTTTVTEKIRDGKNRDKVIIKEKQ